MYEVWPPLCFLYLSVLIQDLKKRILSKKKTHQRIDLKIGVHLVITIIRLMVKNQLNWIYGSVFMEFFCWF